MWFWVRLHGGTDLQKYRFQADGLLSGVSGWHVVVVRLYGANELQKGCFEADVLLFGCLWVACGFGCVRMGQMGL